VQDVVPIHGFFNFVSSSVESEKVEMKLLIPKLLASFEDTIEKQKDLKSEQSLFNSGATISKEDYLKRIVQYGNASISAYIYMKLIMDAYLEKTKSPLNDKNICRLMLASFVFAVKFVDDTYYANKYYSKVGGITLQELNKLEGELFAVLIDDLYSSEMRNRFTSLTNELLSPQYQETFESPVVTVPTVNNNNVCTDDRVTSETFLADDHERLGEGNMCKLNLCSLL
jgi:hypothetical protein